MLNTTKPMKPVTPVRWVDPIPKMDLDMPLIRLTDVDFLTYRNLFEGTLILGATGSGKTSGPGEALALALLQHGMPTNETFNAPDETSES
jgi:hypothetical protein